MSTDTTATDLAVSDQVAELPPHLALMKMENDTIQSLAAARPRDHESIKADLTSQMVAYPSFASEAVYSKPVGRDQGGSMKYARGLSIRAAEAVAEAYGYCRVRSDVTPVDDDTVRVEATFTDFQKGRIWSSAGLLSKFYRSRGGKMTRHADDRFYGLVVKAEESRRIREVILRSVPPGLRSELMEMAERQIDDLLDDTTVHKIVGQFSTKGVEEEVLEKFVGRTRQAGWTKQDRRDLLGVWNAIVDEEVTIDSVFGHLSKSPAIESRPETDGLTGSDLVGGDVVEETRPKKRAVKKATAKKKATKKKAAKKKPVDVLKSAIEKSKKLEDLQPVVDDINQTRADGGISDEESDELVELYAKKTSDLAGVDNSVESSNDVTTETPDTPASEELF